MFTGADDMRLNGKHHIRLNLRLTIFAALVALCSLPVSAADYNVSEDGTLAEAIAKANASTDNETYEISIAGKSADSGTIKTSTLLKGDATAELGGTLTYNGTGIGSTLDSLSFSAGNSSAVINGTPGSGDGQDLTISSVVFKQRNDYYGAGIFNSGNLNIQNGSRFENNHSNTGGAIFSSGRTSLINISDTSFAGNSASGSGGAVNSGGSLNIENSAFNNNVSSSMYGGAIHSSGKALIKGTSFSENKASEGGAIYTAGDASSLTVVNSSFTGNSTTINDYGWYEFGGAINSTGSLNISGSLFDGNFANEAGAIKLRQGSKDSSISSSTFRNNYAATGSGGAVVHDSGSLQISNSTFLKNEAQKGDGGAIYTSASLILAGKTSFTENTASGSGGAINLISGSSLSVSDVSFSNNTAQNGNGGAVNASSAAKVNIDGAEFRQNRADNGYGGALYASGTSFLQNIRVDGNSAALGGGIINFGDMTIGGNSTFTNNRAEAGGAIFTLQRLTLDTSGGNISFLGNTATDTNEGGADIYLNTDGNTTVTIKGDGNVLEMDGGFAGTGYINKDGSNTLIFDRSADNTRFTGTFTQSAGTTLVHSDNFFGGENIISDGSVLHFIGSARADNLALKTGGILDLRSTDGYSPNTLTVAELQSDGSAVIAIQTDGTTSDLLRITDKASGDMLLNVTAAGTNPTKNRIEVIHAETADTSDASFGLPGGKADIGAYEYDLARGNDENWYLETDGDLTNTAKAVSGLPALHLSIVNAGLNELRKRLGDLRSDNPNRPAGTWIRGYGKHLRIHEKVGARMDLLGMEGGVDVKTHMFGGRAYFGVMGGYLSSDNVRVLQSGRADAKGHAKSPTAGLYATWIEDNSNWFVDLAARHFRVHTDLNNIFSNNETNGYDIKRNFWTVSAETGRMFKTAAPKMINRGQSLITVEPKIEVRYVLGEKENFTTDNGLAGLVDETHSLVSRFNLQTTYLPDGEKSGWELFAELGLYNEWIGKTKLNFADAALTTSDLSGLGVEMSLGFNADLADDAYWYGAMTLEAGKTYTSYLFNVGLRVDF